MPDFAAVYAGARERICDLALELESELTQQVPACPAWTVKDLVAHVAGIAADMVTGNVAAVGSNEWTQAQIDARRDKPVQEIVAEWRKSSEQVEGALPHLHPAVAGATVGDLITHEHDLRGAIQRPGARDSEGVEVALDSYVRWFGRRVREAGLPTIEVHADERSWSAGKEQPIGAVRGAPFQLLRALTGRRTKGQIAGFDWSTDAAPYLDVFSAYGLPDKELDE